MYLFRKSEAGINKNKRYPKSRPGGSEEVIFSGYHITHIQMYLLNYVWELVCMGAEAFQSDSSLRFGFYSGILSGEIGELGASGGSQLC